METVTQMRVEALHSHIPVMRPKTTDLLIKELKYSDADEVLEIGTCIGLGVITMLMNGARKVTSIEIDEQRYFTAKKNIEKFNFSNQCEIILGDCKEILPLMTENRYDFIVLDGPKSYYPNAYPLLKRMLRPNGKIFVDDISFHGMIEGDDLPARKHRTNVLRMREFLGMARNDRDFYCCEYDIEDGVMILSNRKENTK